MTEKKQTHKKNKIGIAVFLLGLALIGLTAFTFQSVSRGASEAHAEFIRTEQQKVALIEKADELERGYFYQEALDILNSRPELFDKKNANDPITMKIEDVIKAEKSLVRYDGPVEHVFFHSLIVYPELAFDDKGFSSDGYNRWMTTVEEFKRILPQLESRGYILVPLDQLIEQAPDGTGGIILKDIYLPPGKKPLVMSFDDINYYDYMKGDGFADRLVIGDDGRVWTEVTTLRGPVMQTRDGDAIPILDDYIEEHPEFSWQGAKGTIALTGYEGALGYRITDGLTNTAQMQQQVKAIATVMKKNGWLFACHSHTHWSSFATHEITMEQLKWDMEQWKSGIEPWVGETDIYISPFGISLSNDDARYRMIVSQGFRIFCPVGNDRKMTIYNDNMVMPRVNIDGLSMVIRKDELNKYYFNVDEVYDKSRPALLQ